MGKLTELNDKTFKDFTGKNKKAAVDFWAPWCAPCLKMGPVFEELSAEMKEIAFAKVNVDENQAIAQEYGITAIPNILVFSGGKKVGEITGLRPKESLRAKLEELKG